MVETRVLDYYRQQSMFTDPGTCAANSLAPSASRATFANELAVRSITRRLPDSITSYVW